MTQTIAAALAEVERLLWSGAEAITIEHSRDGYSVREKRSEKIEFGHWDAPRRAPFIGPVRAGVRTSTRPAVDATLFTADQLAALARAGVKTA
jgi:hypothetical protein